MVWNHISDDYWFCINTNVQNRRFSSKKSFNFISFRFVPKSNAHTNKFKLHKAQFHGVSKISYWNIRIIAFWFIDRTQLHSLDSNLIRKYLFSVSSVWEYRCKFIFSNNTKILHMSRHEDIAAVIASHIRRKVAHVSYSFFHFYSVEIVFHILSYRIILI